MQPADSRHRNTFGGCRRIRSGLPDFGCFLCKAEVCPVHMIAVDVLSNVIVKPALYGPKVEPSVASFQESELHDRSAGAQG